MPFTLMIASTSEGAARDPQPLRVVALKGKEAMSALARFDVAVHVPDEDAAERILASYGQPASLTMRGSGSERTFVGVVARTRSHGVDAHGVHRVDLRLRPRLWLAGQRRQSRIFQDLSVAEIVSQVAGEWSVPVVVSLLRPGPKRVYTVQYRETDLAFIERILAEEGIAYWFEPASAMADVELAAETLFLADDPTFYRPLGAPLRFESSASAPTDQHFFSFRATHAVRPGRQSIGEYDWLKPELDARVADDRAPNLERALETTEHEQADTSAPRLVRSDATTRLEQRRRTARVGHGESRSRALRPGVRVALEGNPSAAFDGEWAIVGVEHEGGVGGAAGDAPIYESRFTSVRATDAFRPKRPRRVVQQVVETATVVGPASETIHTDAWGRIKVQFHWDHEGRRDERSSCWIRVMQPWSGAHFGHQFIPRVGMEVLVTFVNGEVDRPIVLGSVYDGLHGHPFPLPSEKTRSGIRTQTVGARANEPTGYNELSFEDAIGRERVLVHASRDLTVDVENDRRAEVRGHDAEQILGDATSLVGGHAVRAVDRTSSEVIGADVTRTIGGAERVLVAGARTAQCASLGVSVTGHAIAEVGAEATLRAGAVRVKADSDISLSTGGDLSIVGRALELRGAEPIRVSTPELTAECDEVTLVGRAVTFHAGACSIRMSDDEIRISGPKIVIDAHDELDCSGGRAGLRLADGARLVGSKVELLGSGARVTLDGDASVLGGSVRLGSGSGAQREVQDPTHDDARPHRLAFSFFVGEGREHTSRAALVVEDRGGRVLARLEAPEAIERAHGHLTWELDPTRFDVPVLVAVIDDRRAHHRVAGPADLRQLTGAMVAGDLASEHRLRGTHPHRRRVRREDPTPAIDPRMDEDARAVKQHRAMEEDVALHDILTHLR